MYPWFSNKLANLPSNEPNSYYIPAQPINKLTKKIANEQKPPTIHLNWITELIIFW